MKKNILKVAFVAAIAIVGGVNVFNSHKTETLSDVVLANVEALAEFEGGIGDKYCTMHIPCFDSNGSTTGKYMADSYKGNTCQYNTPHEHYCKDCSRVK